MLLSVLIDESIKPSTCRVSDAGGELEVMEVGQYPLKMELLDTNVSLPLDNSAVLVAMELHFLFV